MTRLTVLARIAGIEVLEPEPALLHPGVLKMMGRAESPRIQPILENVVTILERDSRWAGRIRYDEFSAKVTLDGRPVTDADEAAAALWLSRAYSVVVASAVAGEAMRLVGRDHAWHPVREYLEALRWDGVPRLDGWLNRYLGCGDDELTRAIGRRWAISAVARAMKPGCKVDTVLILVGGQGAGKSTALRVLGGAWFSDTPIVIGNKDVYEQITGVWLYELAELDAFRRGEWPAIKALLTSPSDNVRRAYARNAVDVPRQGIFVGTTNREDFLADATGSRRFWPVSVSRIDLPALRADRDQLWAEAVAAYHADEPWWLSREQDEQLAGQAERYEVVDPWAAKVAAWCEGRDKIDLEVMLRECCDRPTGQQGPTDTQRGAALLRSLGYERRRERRNGARPAVWVRV